MKAATGKEVVLSMLDLATDIAHWNKKYTTKTVLLQKLEELGWKVDAVLSHTCPERYMPMEAFLSGIDQSTVDNSTEEWLGRIEEKLEYKGWYCGHWHLDRSIDSMRFMYDDLELFDEINTQKEIVHESISE